MNCSVDMVFQMVLVDPCERVPRPHKGLQTGLGSAALQPRVHNSVLPLSPPPYYFLSFLEHTPHSDLDNCHPTLLPWIYYQFSLFWGRVYLLRLDWSFQNPPVSAFWVLWLRCMPLLLVLWVCFHSEKNGREEGKERWTKCLRFSGKYHMGECHKTQVILIFKWT